MTLRKFSFGLVLASVLGLLGSPWLAGQTGSISAKPLTYEVVSIKMNKSESGNMMWSSTPTGIKMENVRLRELVVSAYNLRNAVDEQVTGLPKWAEDTHFDVEAKVSEEDLAAFKKLKPDERAPLLLAALEDRFKLKAHQETRELPIYSLVVAKSGLKMKPAQEGDTYANGMKFNGKAAGAGSMTINMNGSSYHAELQAMTLENMVTNLASQVHRKVQDDTGLTGKYDLKLDWSPDDTKDPAFPGIFTALQEQLGLKLVPSKGPVECVVVDHAEEPTEN